MVSISWGHPSKTQKDGCFFHEQIYSKCSALLFTAHVVSRQLQDMFSNRIGKSFGNISQLAKVYTAESCIRLTYVQDYMLGWRFVLLPGLCFTVPFEAANPWRATVPAGWFCKVSRSWLISTRLPHVVNMEDMKKGPIEIVRQHRYVSINLWFVVYQALFSSPCLNFPSHCI